MTNYYRTIRTKKYDCKSHRNSRSFSLRHHGIEGMRWGVRRYQNPDGSLTALGRRHVGQDADRADVHSRVSKDYKNVKEGANSLGKGFNSASNISSRAKKNANERKKQKAKQSIDLSKMSDKDLQNAVNRLNLERNYKNLLTEEIGSGRDYLTDILATAGDVVAIGASAASIAMAVHAIKGG